MILCVGAGGNTISDATPAVGPRTEASLASYGTNFGHSQAPRGGGASGNQNYAAMVKGGSESE
jgi:hypothetical protein